MDEKEGGPKELNVQDEDKYHKKIHYIEQKKRKKSRQTWKHVHKILSFLQRLKNAQTYPI